MPCRRDGTSEPLVAGIPIRDWAEVHLYTPDGIHIPARLQDLVVTVQEIEASGRKAKAVGSVWSLSKAPDSDDVVIDTRKLNRHLSQPFPSPPILLAATRLVAGGFLGQSEATFRSSDHDAPRLASWAHDDAPLSGRFLLHVEAGIKIRQLLQDLTSAGLAVRTMGAGGGQSLAGAISTGTHGSDVELSVLGDAVRAVHLVGPGGQEWWVEGNGGGGRSVGYSQWPGWCPDTRVIRDSDFLESLVVGVGRFGIIYSIVLEVVAQYRLEEHRSEKTWSSVRSTLQAAIASGYMAPGAVFNDPHSVTGRPLRFWGAVIDAASRSRTWVTRRWRTGNTKDEAVDKGIDLLGYFCTQDAVTAAFVLQLTGGVATTLLNIASAAAAVPIIGFALAGMYIDLANKLLGAAASFKSLGHFAATVIDLLKEFDGLGGDLLEDLIKEISGMVLEGEHDPPTRRGPSERILDTHNYALDRCFSVNSAEFFFDASLGSYIQFIDDVRGVAKDLGPLVGVIALRFVRQTNAQIGMQRFARTVAIEVAISRPGSANAEYMSKVHTLAQQHGGIPHWGQEHKLNEARVEDVYEPDLDIWRWALAETEAGKKQTFTSNFTRTRGLEAPDTLPAYRGRRYFAAIISGTY